MEQTAGSPPRVRGTASFSASNLSITRITPACAGNSERAVSVVLSDEDHPRVCGEQKPSGKLFRFTMGSPPRVRGTAIRGSLPPCRRRITPACAGNRDTPLHKLGPFQDHPRVCGEQPV